MESTGRTIGVTGSKGALGPFVVAALGQAGFRVATDFRAAGRAPRFDLSLSDNAQWLATQWRRRYGKLSGLIALTGKYEKGTAGDFVLAREALNSNFMAVVNVVSALLPDLKATGGNIVAIGAAGEYQPKEMHYRAAKSALDTYLGGISLDEPLIDVAYIVPDGPINTDEKRTSLANYITKLLSKGQTFTDTAAD